MSRPLLDDCFLADRPRMTHGEAIAAFRARVSCIVPSETVAVGHASGRVVAAAVVSATAVPAHTNSAVDGYAYAANAFSAASPAGAPLKISGRAAAGHLMRLPVPAGTAARIFTGAVLPDGADTVAMQEDCELHDGGAAVLIPPGQKSGANVRKAGEDVAAGTTLFQPGHVLRPQDLSALASIGLASVSCYRRLSVGLISSGDEVVRHSGGTSVPPLSPGPLLPGQVYDANGPMLAALVRLAGAEAHDLGVWPDRPDIVEQRLREAAGKYDLLITTGGASKGDEDHMAAAIDRVGRRHVWQIAIKPGRPMMFGQLRSTGGGDSGDAARDTVITGLPGNPVAVFVCFLMYVYPLIRTLGGSSWPEPRRYRLPAVFDFKGRKPGRREFWRGMIVQGADGSPAVDKFMRDGSGLISGLRAADGLIDIPEDHGDVTRGDLVSFIPFTEYGIL